MSYQPDNERREDTTECGHQRQLHVTRREVSARSTPKRSQNVRRSLGPGATETTHLVTALERLGGSHWNLVGSSFLFLRSSQGPAPEGMGEICGGR